MTRAEYLEFVEEGLAFPESGVGSPDPSRILYDHEEVILRLRAAHRDYCRTVASILGIEREDVPLAEELMAQAQAVVKTEQ